MSVVDLHRDNQLLLARVKELEKLAYVPGQFRCPKCELVIICSNLNAHSGQVSANTTPGEQCPNCHVSMWRTTWKDDVSRLNNAVEGYLTRAEVAEAALAEYLKEKPHVLSDQAVTTGSTSGSVDLVGNR